MKSPIKYFLFLLLLLTYKPTLAQTKDQSWKVYDDTQVAKIEITMNQSEYNWMMANPRIDSVHVCSVKFKNKYIDTTIFNVGIRIRGNTSRDAKKKSFKLSFNEYEKGKNFYNIERMNINGEHNDPSIIRSKLCWNLFHKIGLESSRAAHAALYINGEYNGLYISVELIDEEFVKKNFSDDSGNLWKCLYPADLTFKGTDPNVYKYRAAFPAYELTTNETVGDYSQLAHLINIINNSASSAFQDSLESILSIESFLKYQTVDILVGQWDDYWSNQNNYYLYYEPASKKFHFIPYDYDNTFGISWQTVDWTQADPYKFPRITGGGRPLIDKMLAVPQYRDLYSHFLKFYVENVFPIFRWSWEIDQLKTLITPWAESDTYKGLDWGFTNSDFNDSYSSTGYSKLHVKKGLKQYIDERSKNLLPRLTFQNSGPIVYKIDYLPKNPGPNDSIYVYASGFAASEISQMNIQFYPGMLTVIYFYKMKFSPINITNKVEEADRWVGVIPPLGKNGYGRFKIDIQDKNNSTMIYPRTEFVDIRASSGSVTNPNTVVINEFMADNKKTIKDPANPTKDEYDDWVELFNPTSNEISLTGLYMTDDKTNLKKWQFTQADLKIKPGEYLLIWCDEQGSQQGLHANFKLAKEGEYIAIVDKDGVTTLDEFTFGPQQTDVSFGRFPDGGDKWGAMNPTPAKQNTVITKVEREIIPTEFRVSVYPNPFNPSTTIQFTLPTFSDVSIAIYDLLGREIWSQTRNAQLPGVYDIRWNGESNSGQKISAGIYLCKVSAGKFSSTQKLMLLK